MTTASDVIAREILCLLDGEVVSGERIAADILRALRSAGLRVVEAAVLSEAAALCLEGFPQRNQTDLICHLGICTAERCIRCSAEREHWDLAARLRRLAQEGEAT